MSDSAAQAATSQAFADALARARQLAAKLGAGAPASGGVTSPPQVSHGVKRSADEWATSPGDSGPEAKRLAAVNDPFGALLAASKGGGSGPPSTTSSGGGTPFPFQAGSGGKANTDEVHIPDGLVGLIIGRGGEQVTRIQAETGCKVQVAPDNGTGKDRPCYLQGSKDAIDRAKELIAEIISSKSHELGRSGGASTAGPKVAPGSTSIEMMIPGAKVGLIIGKGGETIRSLQDKSGTKMYILQENMFEECDKPLRIVGEQDLVEHARQLVMDLINDTPPKSDFSKPKIERGNSEYGAPGSGGPIMREGGGGVNMETMRFPVPKISVGLIIGKGGEMIKRIQQETGAKVQFDPINSNLGDMDEQLAIITGKSDQIRQAQLRIEELVETALHGGKSDGPPSGERHGGRGRDFHRQHNNSWGDNQGGGGGSGGGGYGKNRGDWEEERMTVPVGRVGMVIGKGGETIRAINQQCGAHCEIDRNGPNDGPERVFLIRGSRQQIEYAKELIMEKVNTLPPKGQREGRGGGHQQYQNNDHYGQNQAQSWAGYGNNAWGQQDPSKMADASAQWAAYYAQYYGQAAAQGQAAPGQPDYTQQWIEYLRAQGQHQQADMLEQQMKAAKPDASAGSATSTASASGSAPAPPGTNGQTSSPAAGAASQPPAPAGQNGQSADYSQQWADHYRSIGKIAEAEAIENYIKAQKAGTVPAASAASAAPAQGAAAAYPGYAAYYGQYYGQAYGGYPGYGAYPPGTAPQAPTAPPSAGSAPPNPTASAPAPPPGTETPSDK